jgi:RNA polymerase sigma-70 factor (ECF subfamily)
MSSTADDLGNCPTEPLGSTRRGEDWQGPASVKEIYERYGDFVWRNLRRLGIGEEAADDALQDVFLVVHRRLSDFESRSSVKTWLFGIVLRVAQTNLRTIRRRRAHVDELAPVSEVESVATSDSEGPAEVVARREASQLLHRLLDDLDHEKRAILILVELEQMSVPDAAEAMNMNLNTAYSRLRAARQAFQDAVTRHRMMDGSNSP